MPIGGSTRPRRPDTTGTGTSVAAPAVYWPALDGMRALAVADVVAGHALPARFTGGGAIGVSMFFVLSGFLITNLLVAEHEGSGSIAFGDFYRRRAARLLPALFVLLVGYVIFCAFGALHDGKRVMVVSVFSSAFYIANIVRAHGSHFAESLGHLWTLATEEQFYLLWPLALRFLLGRYRRRGVLIATLGLAAAFALARVVGQQHFHPLWATEYFSPVSWADALLLGCALGLAFRWGYLNFVPSIATRVFGVTGLVILAWLSVRTTVWQTMFQGELSLVAIASAFVVLWCVRSAPPVLGHGPARFLGRRSYGIYLWSLPAVAVFNGGDPHSPSHAAALAGVCAALAVAFISFRFVELPARRWITAVRPARRSGDRERTGPAPTATPR
jgi:peptidoglycan/LPS O-acetylase OafA/YrhL